MIEDDKKDYHMVQSRLTSFYNAEPESINFYTKQVIDKLARELSETVYTVMYLEVLKKTINEFNGKALYLNTRLKVEKDKLILEHSDETNVLSLTCNVPGVLNGTRTNEEIIASIKTAITAFKDFVNGKKGDDQLVNLLDMVFNTVSKRYKD